jgi:hypothetical protein
MKANQAAFDVGRLAEDMAQGYSAHSAAMTIITRLDAQTLHRVTWNDPVGSVPCKDGTEWSFNLRDFLRLASTKPAMALPFSDNLYVHAFLNRARNKHAPE